MAVIGLMLFTQDLRAYTNEWEWKVADAQTSNGVIQTTTSTFTSKSAAIGYVHGLHSSLQLLDEEKVTLINSTIVRYDLSVSLKGITSGSWGYHGSLNGTRYSTLEELLAIIETNVINQYGPDASIDFDGPWSPVNPNPPPWGADLEQHAVRINHPSASPPWHFIYILRSREFTCPPGHLPNHITGRPPSFYCFAGARATIEGHPLNCPSSGPSARTGNPCDVATGDKSMEETDYAAAGLQFVRQYHSTSLERVAGIGVGWTHNFASRLLASGNEPSGLMRPSGYHDRVASIFGAVRPTESGLEVTKVGAEWSVRLDDGTKEFYNAEGYLVRVVARGGATTTLFYDAARRLASVVGPYGHSLQFDYEGFKITPS